MVIESVIKVKVTFASHMHKWSFPYMVIYVLTLWLVYIVR